MVRMGACRVPDRGSIPRRGVFLDSNLENFFLLLVLIFSQFGIKCFQLKFSMTLKRSNQYIRMNITVIIKPDISQLYIKPSAKLF